MNWIYGILALLAGALLPLQSLINARLGQSTTGPLFASMCSFMVGTLVLVIVLGVSRQSLPSEIQLVRIPMWVWGGGVLGAIFVLIATITIPRLGASSLIALVVLGQITGSLILDHFGVLQRPQPMDLIRLGGALLVVMGVLLVVQPWKAH